MTLSDAASSTPILFDLDLLQPGRDEAHVIDKLIAKLRTNNEWTFKKFGHGLRDAHSKSHAVLRGTLIVDEHLDPPLAQGLFAEPGKSYDVIARISSTFPTIRSDQIRGIRAIALKVLGVDDPRARPDNASNQDFVLVNHDTFPYAGAKSYLRQGMAAAWMLTRVPDCLLKPSTEALAALDAVFHLPLPAAARLLILPNYHILGFTFSTASALRYGDYVAKISLVPSSPSVLKLMRALITRRGGSDAHRLLIKEFFAANSAEYEMHVQLCTDPRVIEDARMPWTGPSQPVAKLVFDQQMSDCFCARVYADDVLSFNSWTAMQAHTPLGSINRLKAKVYDASSEFRHGKNNAPRVEPTSITELPSCTPNARPCASGRQESCDDS
ncbi:hypothetical protein Mycsm_02689 [Mycobacterium sp. JS623]|uniref:catalase family protein n=1 Tax=Mycobacterium sp. JS623 TaxID=212767 RepID=UPI0002A59C4C|nr:catalase family protein [Mycobacterium sp. JS623]AGB23018.1 hypothetical protein Mycsm_02689 [Mycobacterium sp. JS623]